MLSSSDFYNAVANQYSSYCNASDINTFLEIEIYIVESLNPSSILEFGIGNGRFAKEYIQRNKKTLYVGVDNSKEMLSLAKDSGAFLVFAEFQKYLAYLIQERKTFDCIVAPYTAIHHIKTSEQYTLFQNMKKVAQYIILNCVTNEEEAKLFKDRNRTVITFSLPESKQAKTTVYKINQRIRKETITIKEGNTREYLFWKK